MSDENAAVICAVPRALDVLVHLIETGTVSLYETTVNLLCKLSSNGRCDQRTVSGYFTMLGQIA